MNFLRARSAAPGGDGFPITNIEAEVVAGVKGRKANYGVDRSAPGCPPEIHHYRAMGYCPFCRESLVDSGANK